LSNPVVKKIFRIVAIVAFNLATIVAILYGFEFLFSPYRRMPKDGWFGDERYTWGHLVVKNHFGFREREFDIPKPDGVYRVMVLGDSFTWGVGLAEEERYTAIAQSLLEGAFPGRKFEILNFGSPGLSTVDEKDRLNKYIDQVDPDLIVVGFTLNDTQPKSQDYSIEREELDQRGGDLLRKFTYQLYRFGLRFVAEIARKAFYTPFEMRGVIPTWEVALDRTYAENSDEWKAFEQALYAIKSTSEKRGLPGPVFLVLNQGTSTSQLTDYGNPNEELKLYLRWYRQAEQAAEQLGYVVFDQEAEIAERLTDEPLSVNPLDAHPSAKLNQIYGEKLYQAIAQLLDQTSQKQP
jgi:lysophospholipase L1-like esterase